jgi:ectoine hydroxylase-related dioxygenase (phytanoyl-CoA dioxygenase family)
MSCPAVAELAHHPSLLRLAHGLLGGQAQPFRATLFDKSPRANWLVPWHQDTALPIAWPSDAPGWGPWSTKAGVHYAHAPAEALQRVVALRVHLDPSDADNGPLRVLPGSHTRGVLDDHEILRLTRSVSPVECHADGGGIVWMRPLAVHASSKASSRAPRRVLHLEYCSDLELGGGLALQVA